jgi:hypothetical protein
MDKREEEFEAFLRQFPACRPRPLPELIPQRRIWRRTLLAALLLLLVYAGVWHFSWRGFRPEVEQTSTKSQTASQSTTNTAEVLTPGRLTRLALMNPDELDRTLTEASPGLLPHIERSGSMLHALSQE